MPRPTGPSNFYMQANTQPRLESPLKHSLYVLDDDSASDTSSIVSEHVDAGRLDEYFYDTTLSWWRASIRRTVLNQVERESDIIAAMQVSFGTLNTERLTTGKV